MNIYLYNTLSRKKEKFVPLKKGNVGIYSCGPTVYSYQHIGNLRGFLTWDFLKRIFVFNGYKVKHIINVTDVGHLTSDSDSGDDKIERAAQKEGRSAKEIAQFYFQALLDDLHKLNYHEPDGWPKATEHINGQISLIQTLEKKGFTYKTSDGIYFDTSKLPDYGKLARLNVEHLRAGKRIALGEKKNKTDFALWKFSGDAKREQEWKSPWGVGFPGWHLECSAMSSKYLGKHFDIHTGGQEHIPVHHTNEIAQSEAAFSTKPWVKYWLHNAWLLMKREKMSKSKGNLFRLADLETKGYEPLAFRYLLLGTHYRKPINFTFEHLEKAQTALQHLRSLVSEFPDDKKTNKVYLESFTKAINDDINLPKALQVVWKFVRDKIAKGKRATIARIDEVLGLGLIASQKKVIIPPAIQKLVQAREEARRDKNWKRADELRDEIHAKGYEIEDTPDGAKVKKV